MLECFNASTLYADNGNTNTNRAKIISVFLIAVLLECNYRTRRDIVVPRFFYIFNEIFCRKSIIKKLQITCHNWLTVSRLIFEIFVFTKLQI